MNNLSVPQILVVDCGSKKIGSIEEIVFEFGFRPLRIRLSDLEQANSAHFSGTIISGSPILLTETDVGDHIKAFEFIRTGRNPVLGICFGHQIMGLLHGARVFRGPECRTNTTLEVLEGNTLFEGLGTNLSVQEDHCEGITPPASFTILAKSEKYDVEAMKHRDRPLYGVQFHPEVSGKIGSRIMGNFLNLCQKY